MSVECTNPNLKSAQTAQLGQPAPKLELYLYIPQASKRKTKVSFVIRRQTCICGELRYKKILKHVIYLTSVSIPNFFTIHPIQALCATK